MDAPGFDVSRRRFLKTSLRAAAVVGFPTIVPPTVFGKMAPSKRINVGAIGVGRMRLGLEASGRREEVCNEFYSNRSGKAYDGVARYANYRELLANKDVDAVVNSTPDHQHAILAVAVVRARKDVYL